MNQKSQLLLLWLTTLWHVSYGQGVPGSPPSTQPAAGGCCPMPIATSAWAAVFAFIGICIALASIILCRSRSRLVRLQRQRNAQLALLTMAGFARDGSMPGEQREGLDPELIDRIPAFTYKKSKSKNEMDLSVLKASMDVATASVRVLNDVAKLPPSPRQRASLPPLSSKDSESTKESEQPKDAAPKEGSEASAALSIEVQETDCCVVCLCDYEDGEDLRMLPCVHYYHKECIDEWLRSKHTCPLCHFDLRKFLQGSTGRQSLDPDDASNDATAADSQGAASPLEVHVQSDLGVEDREASPPASQYIIFSGSSTQTARQSSPGRALPSPRSPPASQVSPHRRQPYSPGRSLRSESQRDIESASRDVADPAFISLDFSVPPTDDLGSASALGSQARSAIPVS